MFDLSSHFCSTMSLGQYSAIITISDRRMSRDCFYPPFKPHLVVKGIAYKRTERDGGGEGQSSILENHSVETGHSQALCHIN